MGFYDCRCLLTGVSLKGANAALVLLQPWHPPFARITLYEPIAFAIQGSYNRLGAIDCIVEDENSNLVLTYFMNALQTGALVCDEEYLRGHHCYPFQRIGDALQACERNIQEDPSYLLLNGRPVVFALIAQAVWDAIAVAALPTTDSAATLFEQLFPADSAAREIYAAGPPTKQVHAFAACSAFMANRGIQWRPTEQDGQHFGAEMREYLAAARASFANSLAVLAGLREYELAVSELFLDD